MTRRVLWAVINGCVVALIASRYALPQNAFKIAGFYTAFTQCIYFVSRLFHGLRRAANIVEHMDLAHVSDLDAMRAEYERLLAAGDLEAAEYAAMITRAEIAERKRQAPRG